MKEMFCGIPIDFQIRCLNWSMVIIHITSLFHQYTEGLTTIGRPRKATLLILAGIYKEALYEAKIRIYIRKCMNGRKFVVCIGNPNKTRHLGIHHVGGGRDRTRYAHRPFGNRRHD